MSVRKLLISRYDNYLDTPTDRNQWLNNISNGDIIQIRQIENSQMVIHYNVTSEPIFNNNSSVGDYLEVRVAPISSYGGGFIINSKVSISYVKKGGVGPMGPTGADSTVVGPRGPTGADSTVPGPEVLLELTQLFLVLGSYW